MRNNGLPLILNIAAFLMAGSALLCVIMGDKIPIETNGISIATGLMAVCATFIVGFQIYEKVEDNERMKRIKSKIKDIEKLQTENAELQLAIRKNESALLANQIINNAEFIYRDNTHYRESAPEFALIKIFDAIIPAMDANWHGAAYDSIFNAMDAYIEHAGQSGIIEYCKRMDGADCPVNYTVYRFDLDIRAKSNAIKSHYNYHLVSKEFEQRLSKIETKLAEARNSQ